MMNERHDPYAGRAADYAAYRLAYSEEAFGVLASLAGLHGGRVVADVGSGTGNATAHLLAHAGVVYAIEPSAPMRAMAESRFAGLAGFRSVAACAEDTGLPDGSVDLIVVGQALHWFDEQAARCEFRRILTAGGYLAAVWTQFAAAARPEVDAWFAADTRTCRTFPMCVQETWEQYVGGARSAAGAPLPGDAGYEGFERGLRERFDAAAIAGMMEVRYTTELVVGRLGGDSRVCALS